MKKITPIILSGGVGLRLWPLSTTNLPKQFLKLPFNSKYNLFEQTLLGLKKSKVFDKPLIICSEKHKFLILESLEKLKVSFEDIIVEKISKNTASSVLIGVLFCMRKKRSEYSLILPSDHFIPRRDYSCLVPNTIDSVESHLIFGIKPKFASVDYGYVCRENKNKKISKVSKFFEKPNKHKAKIYLSRGYYWNSGIFLLNNKKLKSEFKEINPKMFATCSKIISQLKIDLDFIETDLKSMKKLPEISFDRAFLEKTKSLSMMEFKQTWFDLGAWNTLSDLSEQNVMLNKKAKIINNSKNSNVISDKKNTILNDVPNIVVISQKESLLISSKKNVGNVKKILEDKKNKSFTDFQNVFYKPWGQYETFIDSQNYLVKKLTIKPKHRLSLQLHKFRSEHWIVVEGTAKITKGKSRQTLHKNESTFIPQGVVHCIENIGEKHLEIIEVQMGKILKETDIIRLDDPYKREK